MPYPTKKLGEHEMKILVFVKAMFLQGCSFSKNEDEISRMMAIHIFDNVVETILKLLAVKSSMNPPKEKKDWNFPDLLRVIKDHPIRNQIHGLHEQRNRAQHHADIPSIETIIKYRGYTEDFLKDIFQNKFNISYDDISLSSLIRNKNLKETFLKAERLFKEEKYKETIEQIEEVFVKAVFDEADVFSKAGILTGYFQGGQSLSRVIKGNYADRYASTPFYEFAEDVSRAILELGQAATGMQFIGEYKMNFLDHRRRVADIENIPSEKLKEEALGSLNFVINLILKWQEEKIL